MILAINVSLFLIISNHQRIHTPTELQPAQKLRQKGMDKDSPTLANRHSMVISNLRKGNDLGE